MKIIKTYSLDTEQHPEIIAYLDGLPARQHSSFMRGLIRQAMAHGKQQEAALALDSLGLVLGEIRQDMTDRLDAMQRQLDNLGRGVIVQAAPQEQAGIVETPEQASLLDSLGAL